MKGSARVMRLLLDTHALLWSALKPAKLSPAARQVIEDGANDVYVSAISAFEIATKVRLGRLEFGRPLATDFATQVHARGFTCLAVTPQHGEAAGKLAIPHNDPWDRLLMAQAQVERLLLVTADADMQRLCASTYW